MGCGGHSERARADCCKEDGAGVWESNRHYCVGIVPDGDTAVSVSFNDVPPPELLAIPQEAPPA